MTVAFLFDEQARSAALWCTSSQCAFGPVLEEVANAGIIQRFLRWSLDGSFSDLRELTPDRILDRFDQFLAEDSVSLEPAARCPDCALLFRARLWPHLSGDASCPCCGLVAVRRFDSIDLCAHCGEELTDRASHTGCAVAHGSAAARKKPPAPSIDPPDRCRKRAG